MAALPIYNAKDQGAAANGTTDDTTVLQTLLAAIGTAGGGALLLPPGTYILSEPLVVPSNCVFAGAGRNVTTLSLANGSDCSILLNSDTAAGNSGITVTDLTLYGNRANNTGTLYGLYFRGISDSVIRDVEVSHCGNTGVYLDGGGATIGTFASMLTVSGIYTHDNVGVGIQVSNGIRRSTFSDIITELNGTSGVVCDSSQASWNNVRAFRNSTRGVYFRNLFSITANNIVAEGNGEHGILVQGMVRSAGSNWVSLTNSTSSTNGYDDINFGPNPDPAGYGENNDLDISGIVAGWDAWIADRYFGDVMGERYAVYVGDESDTNIRLSGRLRTGATGTYRPPATPDTGYEADFS